MGVLNREKVAEYSSIGCIVGDSLGAAIGWTVDDFYQDATVIGGSVSCILGSFTGVVVLGLQLVTFIE